MRQEIDPVVGHLKGWLAAKRRVEGRIIAGMTYKRKQRSTRRAEGGFPGTMTITDVQP